MKVLEHRMSAKNDPRRMSSVQLARLGIEVLNKHALLLRCMTCGETWSPQLDRNGMLTAGYWQCANKCNV
jgi:hypothetical protein